MANPSDTPSGTCVFPLSRIKRTINADEDIEAISSQSVFLIAKATELFVMHLAERAFTAGKAEKKDKKTLQYKDVANIAARTDNLEFLCDLVPQTQTWKQHKAKVQRENAKSAAASRDILPAGQQTIDGRRPHSNPADISILSDTSVPAPAPPSTNGSARRDSVHKEVRRHESHVNGDDGRQHDDEDIEMG